MAFLRRDPLERRLRESRPVPRGELVRALETRIAAERPPRRSARLRIGLAAALTAALASALAAFGGIGYAASGVTHAAHAVASVLSFQFRPHRLGTISAGADQYGRVTMCHNGTVISVGEPAVPAHLAQGDTIGPCPVYAPPIVPAAGGTVDLGRSRQNLIVIDTKRGDHEVTTGAGNDKITTGGGNDVIRPGKGDNVVYSGAGNDTIIAGGGHDTIFAGSGDDTIYVRDGNSDFVDCGPGVDIVFADPAKLDYVAKDCEIVRRAVFKRR
jgi:hypothetical protein